jgi:hypothetical protein
MKASTSTLGKRFGMVQINSPRMSCSWPLVGNIPLNEKYAFVMKRLSRRRAEKMKVAAAAAVSQRCTRLKRSKYQMHNSTFAGSVRLNPGGGAPEALKPAASHASYTTIARSAESCHPSRHLAKNFEKRVANPLANSAPPSEALSNRDSASETAKASKVVVPEDPRTELPRKDPTSSSGPEVHPSTLRVLLSRERRVPQECSLVLREGRNGYLA